MSSPLNAILGNNPLTSMAMNIASIAFPQVAIASQLANMAVSALGGALSGAMDTLTKEHGMPKFLGDLVKNCVQNVLPQFMNPALPDCADFLQDKVGDKFEKFRCDLMRDFVDTFMNYKKDGEKEANGGGEAGKGGGKSWFVAMMQALGELQNKQAEKLEKLQGEVSESLTGADASKEDRQAEFDKMEEFKAEAKLQEVLASVAKTIGDAVGNALNAVARPQ